MVRVGLVFLLLLLSFGCSHLKTRSAIENSPEDEEVALPGVPVQELESFRVSDAQGPALVDRELEDIPVEINPAVEQWIRFFQGRGRSHFEIHLARSARYEPLMKKILRDNGLPEDLFYIALIESGFSPRATSHAAAVGYWQFIRGTGRRYNLEINSLIDERRDPVLSTQAAADYFKTLYGMFGSWYLAMASYNVGENRVLLETKRHRTQNFWELARKRALPRETVNYVPKYLAAKLIAKNPEGYGFSRISYEAPIEFELVKIPHHINLKILAEQMNLSYDELKRYNPKFRSEMAPTSATGLVEVRVPLGHRQQALAASSTARVDQINLLADSRELTTYRVRPGDNLGSIARRFGTSAAVIRDMNEMSRRSRIRVGQVLTVPNRAGASNFTGSAFAGSARLGSTLASSDGDSSESGSNSRAFYMVRSGDNLSTISRRTGVSITRLRYLNNLNTSSVLRVGQRLFLNDESASAAQRTSSGQVLNADRRVVAAGAGLSHTVRRGENLFLIARRYGVSVEALVRANDLSPSAILRVGSRLVIPKEALGEESSQDQGSSLRKSLKKTVVRNLPKTRVHWVRRGENLQSIAARYNTSVRALIAKNSIQNPSKLLVGTKLLVPVETRQN